jgi:predicted N-formylglutamate amidohydrolase
VVESEGRAVPANVGLSAAERAGRIERIHVPYHDAIDACCARRRALGLATILIAIHSYTPVYLGKARLWQVGIVFDEDARMGIPRRNSSITPSAAMPARITCQRS